MTTHSHTWFRKRIGGIEFTRRRFALILSTSVQHPRAGVTPSVSSRISAKRFNELSCQSKASALFKSDDLIKRFMISRQSDVDTHWILHDRSSIIYDESSRSTVIENVESWRTLWIIVVYLVMYTWLLGHWSVRYDFCMTDWSCFRSVSLQGCVLFSLPSTSNKFGNLLSSSRKIVTRLLRQEKRNLIIDFCGHKGMEFDVEPCDALCSHSSRVKFVNTTETDIIQYFLLCGTHSTLSLKNFTVQNFFRRHRYRVTFLSLITESVSDYLLKTMSKTTLILVKMSWNAISTDMRRRRYYLVRSTRSYLTFNEVRQSKTTKDKDNSNDTARQYTAEYVRKMNMNIVIISRQTERIGDCQTSRESMWRE